MHLTPASRREPSATARAARSGLRILALLVALAALAWTLFWAAWTPEPWHWRAAVGEAPLVLLPDSLLMAQREPHFVIARALHVGLLYLPGSDIGRFCFVGWCLAALVCGAVLLLWRRTGVDASSRPIWPIWPLLLALLAFSPAFGADWLLDARFRLFLPPLCLLGGVLLLSGGSRFGARFAGAACLSTLAIFSDWTGAVVWVALAPLVLGAARRRRLPRPGSWLALWCLLGNLGLLLCYRDFHADERAAVVGIVAHALTEPRETLLFLCQAAGSFDEPFDVPVVAAFGGACLVLLALLSVLLLFWKAHPARDRALPWWALAAFGAGAALLLTDRLFRSGLPQQTLREFSWATMLLPIGLAGLSARLFPAATRRTAPWLALPFLLILLIDWQNGWSHLQRQRARLLQGSAQLVFAELAVTEMSDHPPPPLAPGMIPALRGRDRLTRITPVKSLLLGQLSVGQGTPPGRVLELRGLTIRGRLSAGHRADLILITVERKTEAERIVRISSPTVEAEQRGEWSADLARAGLIPGDLIRLYGFLGRRLEALPLSEQYRVAQDGRLISVEREE